MKAVGRERLKNVFEIMKKFRLDGIVLINKEELIDPNIQYFTSCRQESGLGDCILLIRKRERKLIVRKDFDEKLDAEKIIRVEHFRASELKKFFRGIKRVGVNSEYLSHHTANFLSKKFKMKLFDVSSYLKKIREVKTKKEIKIFEEGFKLTEKLIDFIEKEILEKVKEGKLKEREIAVEIENWVKRKGHEMSFRTLVSTGKRSAQIHSNPSSSMKLAQKIGYIDFGINYNGYHTDVTLPFALRKLNKKEEETVEILLGTYENVLENIRVGMLDYEVFNLANNYLKKFGLELKHGLGHGIGLEIHEYPSLLPKTPKRDFSKIENNMVFTIEPGIYLKNFGFRIEDDFVVKKGKIIPMTNSHFIKI